MNLTAEQIALLERTSGLGKKVQITYKDDRRIKIPVGTVDDEVSVLADQENKYVVQRIRCNPEQAQQHGPHLYRVSYYTINGSGRPCLGGQYAPLMDAGEFRALLDQVAAKGWPER